MADTGRKDGEAERRQDPDEATLDTRAGGPSPNADDRAARAGGKSEWMQRTDSAAGDPPTKEERDGMDLLGRSEVRDGAIPGVSGLSGMDARDLGPDRSAHRRNPPQMDDVNNSAGDLSQTGGVAGGFRGSAGRSDAGAGDPDKEAENGPAEYKASSRFDLDHPGRDVGDEEG